MTPGRTGIGAKRSRTNENRGETTHLLGNLFKLWLHYSLGMPHKNQNCIIFNIMKEAIIWQKEKQKITEHPIIDL
jgi:hypothetical protein